MSLTPPFTPRKSPLSANLVKFDQIQYEHRITPSSLQLLHMALHAAQGCLGRTKAAWAWLAETTNGHDHVQHAASSSIRADPAGGPGQPAQTVLQPRRQQHPRSQCEANGWFHDCGGKDPECSWPPRLAASSAAGRRGQLLRELLAVDLQLHPRRWRAPCVCTHRGCEHCSPLKQLSCPPRRGYVKVEWMEVCAVGENSSVGPVCSESRLSSAYTAMALVNASHGWEESSCQAPAHAHELCGVGSDGRTCARRRRRGKSYLVKF